LHRQWGSNAVFCKRERERESAGIERCIKNSDNGTGEGAMEASPAASCCNGGHGCGFAPEALYVEDDIRSSVSSIFWLMCSRQAGVNAGRVARLGLLGHS